jgi:hypothetical protein
LEAELWDFGGSGDYLAAVTYEPAFLSVRDRGRPLGVLRRYVCRRCGYCQTFADEPQDIPVGSQYGTNLIANDESKPAYR